MLVETVIGDTNKNCNNCFHAFSARWGSIAVDQIFGLNFTENNLFKLIREYVHFCRITCFYDLLYEVIEKP